MNVLLNKKKRPQKVISIFFFFFNSYCFLNSRFSGCLIMLTQWRISFQNLVKRRLDHDGRVCQRSNDRVVCRRALFLYHVTTTLTTTVILDLVEFYKDRRRHALYVCWCASSAVIRGWSDAGRQGSWHFHCLLGLDLLYGQAKETAFTNQSDCYTPE